MLVPDKPMEFPDPSQRDWEDREYEADCPCRHTAEGCLWHVIAEWRNGCWHIIIYDDDGSHAFTAGRTLKSMQAAGKRAIETHIRREHSHDC